MLTILNINTVRNVQVDFLLGCFFREDVTQNRNSGDVVGPEVAFSFAEKPKKYDGLKEVNGQTT